MTTFTLSAADYVVFSLVLVVSSAIGIYFARRKSSGRQKKGGRSLYDVSEGQQEGVTANNETDDYLVGGRNMHWFPLSISFMATYISGTVLLGVPAEIYTYGFQYVISCGALVISTFFTWYIFIPIFYRLKIVCANEYLELRFTPGVRIIGCALMSLYMLIQTSIMLYGPALAFQAVGGVPIYLSIILTGMVCVFYTTIGGMKAVVWTDCFQAFVMIAGLFVVIVLGVEEVGGFHEMFKKVERGERMNFAEFSPDPRIRNTVWSLVIGLGFTILPAWAVGPQSVQRFQAARSLKQARLALLWNFPAMLFISLLAMIAGLVIYAVNADCDIGVFGLKLVARNDQVLPYFIMQKLGHLPGIPGLFMAVLFSGALSSVSSGINALSAVLLEDFVKKIRPNISDSNGKKMSMVIAFVTGLMGIGFSFVVSNLGSVITQIAFSVVGIFGSPYLGLFVLGMMIPWSNWKGAYAGFFCGLGFTLWLSIGAILYPPNSFPAVVHVDGCPGFNSTNATNPILRGSGVIRPADLYVAPTTPLASFYSISFLWYGPLGLLVTVFFGSITSAISNSISKRPEGDIDPLLLFDYRFSARKESSTHENPIIFENPKTVEKRLNEANTRL